MAVLEKVQAVLAPHLLETLTWENIKKIIYIYIYINHIVFIFRV